MSSIGGNINYIYGNTLVLGDSSYLEHHGIKGQKWGVRRFQNPDGSRTAEGKKRYRSRRTVFEDYQNAQLDNVISNNKYNYKRHPIKYNPIKRSILKKKAYDLREEYDDVLKNGRTNSGLFQKPIKGSISLTANEKKETLDAVRTADIEIRNPKYRFYDKVSFLAAATEKSTISACKKLAWYDAKRMDNEERRFVISEDLEDMYASFKKKNPGSQKEQFEKFNKIPEVKKLIDESDRLFDENEQLRKEQDSECHRVAATVFDTTEWAKPFGEPRDGYTETYLSVLERAINVNSVMYASRTAKKNIEHSSIGGTMNYIYGNTLVLGDSSYLEHHGIKNQKWGIRRFQNPDGSLTAAGRIRYGVTGAAKAAFKVGKKLGAATASAARAGVKKAKDNAYAKKKEKASQTREGVLKNKKMFTNEELERLEKRFKIEDDMRNASLRHGQEIAKTISAYSDAAVKTMNALQTGGKAVKAISDGLSALQDYKEKRDIGKKASDAGMSTDDYKNYTKSRMEDKAKRDNERAQKKADEAEKRAAEYKEKQAQAKAEAEAKAKADKEEAERQSIEKSKDVARRQKQDIMDAIAAKKQAKADAEQAKKDQAAAERKELRALKKEAEERKALDKVNRIKAEEERLKSAAKKASQPEPLDTSEKGVKTVIKNSVAGTNKETSNSIRSAIQSIIKSSSGSKSGLDKLKKMAKDHAEDVKDSPDVDAVNDAYLKKLQSLLNNIKHSDMDELAHFGVKGMKWGKHLMAGKGSSTDISSGGGGGAPEEEDDETIADILGIDVDAYRQKINEGPFGYGQYADQLGEKAEKLHAQAEANRKMADQVGLTGNKKKSAEFRKKSEQLKKDAVKAEKLQTYMNRRANGESALGITADTVNTTIVKPITSLAKNIGKSASASNPMNSDLVRKLRRVKHGSMGSFMIENGILRYGFDESDYLEHHGIKGQRWGVRRFQNADGSLTDKGRKHYQKKLALEERKLTAANAARGQYERVRTPMSVGMGILGAVAGAMVGVPAGPAGIAAGAAVVSSIAASSNYAAYTVAGIVAGQGAKRNMKKIAKYKEALAQDAFEIQNGVLIYGSGQSGELKHFGIKGMKWGVRRFQNKDGTRTAAGKKREKDYAAKNNSVREKFYYTDGTVRKGASAYVYKRGPGISSKYVGSERVGSTRKQAKAEAAAEALLFDKGRYGKTLSDRDRKRLQRDVRKGDEELSQIKTLASATEHQNLHDLERYKKAGNRLSVKAVEKRLVRDRQYFEKADASDLQTEKNIYNGHRYAAAIAVGIGAGLASSGVLPAAAASVAVGASIVTALSSAATIDLHTSAHRDIRLKNGMDKMDSTRQRDKLRERQEKEAERERKKQLRSKR